MIRADRHFGTLKLHREKLREFASAELNGEFFRPMQSVKRARILEDVTERTPESALNALTHQVQELRQLVATLVSRNEWRDYASNWVSLADLATGTAAPPRGVTLNTLATLGTLGGALKKLSNDPSKGET